VTDFPDGVPVQKVVSDVFDKEGEVQPDADYQLARRFVLSCDRLQTDRHDGILWVYPDVPTRHLEQQLAYGETPRRDGDEPKQSETAENEPNRYAKDRVSDYLEDVVQVRSDSIRSWMLEELAVELRSISERYSIFRHRDKKDEYITIPYRTRFNDVSRSLNPINGFKEALSNASEEYEVGTFLTLTVDPKRFDGHTEAIDALYDNRDRLMSWLGTDSRLGYTPDKITVLEFQDNGMPHFHICFFGVTPSELPSHDEILRYWDERRDVGSQIDVREVRYRDGSFLLRDPDQGDDGKVSLCNYLTDSMYDLIRVANTDPDELVESATDGDTSLWKQALYWVTGKEYWSGSPSLNEQDGEDSSLPYVSMWEYVGTYHASDIPARVLRNSTVPTGTGNGSRDSPPPD
jgi:hypothetical protein